MLFKHGETLLNPAKYIRTAGNTGKCMASACFRWAKNTTEPQAILRKRWSKSGQAEADNSLPHLEIPIIDEPNKTGRCIA